jgi:hypothetical protein
VTRLDITMYNRHVLHCDLVKRMSNYTHTNIAPVSPVPILLYDTRDSSVGIALGYGLDDRGSRFRFPTGAGNFSFHHRVQNGSGAHPASYPMGTRGSFPGNKAAGREADHSPPSSVEIKE